MRHESLRNTALCVVRHQALKVLVARAKRGYSLISGLSYNVGFVLPWQQHFKKFDILYLQIATGRVFIKLKLEKKELLRQLRRKFHILRVSRYIYSLDSKLPLTPSTLSLTFPPLINMTNDKK